MNLPDKEEYTFSSKKVPIEDMTPEEKRLLFAHYVSKNDFRQLIYPVGTVVRLLDSRIQRGFPIPETTEGLLYLNGKPIYDKRHEEWTRGLLTSPVTGQLMEFNKSEFSLGNAYIRLLTDDEILQKFNGSKWKKEEGRTPPPGTKRSYYIRVYGTKGILAEFIEEFSGHYR